MSRHIETVEGLFGEKIHYENGKKVGESWPGLFSGSYDHYDADGNKVGHSDPGLFSDLNHYDEQGNYRGYSQRGIFGGMDHYDEDDHIGYTTDTLFGQASEFDD